MKKVYTIPVTIMLSIDAENESHIQDILGDMEYIFKHEDSQIEMISAEWNTNDIEEYY